MAGLARGDLDPTFFVPLWLCARYIGAAFGFGGAACLRAVGEVWLRGCRPLRQPFRLPPPHRKSMGRIWGHPLTHNLRLCVAQSLAQCLQPALDAVGLKPHGGAG